MINPDVKSKIRRELNFSDRELVLAGISTWQGEEELLIELVQSLRLEKIDISCSSFATLSAGMKLKDL